MTDVPPHIPAKLDVLQILEDLNASGIRDYKIEMICGCGEGYVSHLKAGRILSLRYETAARLFNLWRDELQLRVSRGTEIPQDLTLTIF